MKGNPKPVLGNWYRYLDKGHEFQVVTYDDIDGIVEILHYDGEVEALEVDDWDVMELEHIEPPQEWAGPMEDFEGDDWDEGLDDWSVQRLHRGED